MSTLPSNAVDVAAARAPGLEQWLLICWCWSDVALTGARTSCIGFAHASEFQLSPLQDPSSLAAVQVIFCSSMDYIHLTLW